MKNTETVYVGESGEDARDSPKANKIINEIQCNLNVGSLFGSALHSLSVLRFSFHCNHFESIYHFLQIPLCGISRICTV